jgi:uncharacterized protein (DUF2147 family)
MTPITLPLMIALAAAQPAPRPAIDGLWKNPIGSAVIAIAPCGNARCGKVVWASARGRREVANTTSHIVGTVVLTGVRPSGNAWAGRLFIPDDNIHVSARLQLLSGSQLKLTGCAVAGIFCRSQVWTRTDQPAPASD